MPGEAAARGFGEEYDTTRLSPGSGAAGTMPYMAPEIIRGQPSVASDIWAMGVLLFEMATGRRPFGGATPYELAANILSNERTAAAQRRAGAAASAPVPGGKRRSDGRLTLCIP